MQSNIHFIKILQLNKSKILKIAPAILFSRCQVSAFCAVRWVALDPADGGTKELSALWKSQELLPSFGVLKVNPQHGARHRAAVHLLDTAHDHTHMPAHTHRHTELQRSAHLSQHGFKCEIYTSESLVLTSLCERSHFKISFIRRDI